MSSMPIASSFSRTDNLCSKLLKNSMIDLLNYSLINKKNHKIYFTKVLQKILIKSVWIKRYQILVDKSKTMDHTFFKIFFPFKQKIIATLLFGQKLGITKIQKTKIILSFSVVIFYFMDVNQKP